MTMPNESNERYASKKARELAMDLWMAKTRKDFFAKWQESPLEELRKEIFRVKQRMFAMHVDEIDGEFDAWRLAALTSIYEERTQKE